MELYPIHIISLVVMFAAMWTSVILQAFYKVFVYGLCAPIFIAGLVTLLTADWHMLSIAVLCIAGVFFTAWIDKKGKIQVLVND